MNGISVHTMTFSLSLKTHQFLKTLKYLYEKSKEKNIGVKPPVISKKEREETFYGFAVPCTERYLFTVFSDTGITINLVSYQERVGKSIDYIMNTMFLRVNPRRVAGNKNLPYVGLFDTSQTDTMLDRINSILYSISDDMPDIRESVMRRLDYCMNYDFNFRNIADEYMHALTKARLPKKFNLYEIYNEEEKRVCQPANSIKIHNKSYSVSIYAKQSQMETEKKIKYPDMEEAKGIVRFEIQANYQKLYYIQKDAEVTNAAQCICRSNIDGHRIFSSILPKMYGTGDFFRLPEALEIIETSDNTPATKNTMSLIVEMTHKGYSFEQVLELFDEFDEFSDRQRDYLLKKFDKLGISPITLSDESEFVSFPNPMKLIDNDITFIWYSDRNFTFKNQLLSNH